MKDSIIPLFPIPISRIIVPNKLASIIPFLDSQEMNSDDPNKEGLKNYGSRSKNTYILNESKCKLFKDFILDNVKKYSFEILGTYEREYKLAQSWISHKDPGQSHVEHTHPNSYISGVFYYGDAKDSTPSIQFHSPLHKMNQQIYVPLNMDKPSNEFNYNTFSIPYEPGTLVLFPSWLPHSVPINNTSQVRKSLSFNCVPLNNLGNEEDLTELKF